MKNNEIDKLKVAFIGGGLNSAVGAAHYAAINIDNNFELVAGFFSRNKEINHETANTYKVSIDRVYDCIEDLIFREKDRIDAIIVLTPTDQHTGQIIQFLENKIPVICEKSLTYSIEGIDAIRKTLNENNGFLTVIYNYLGYPMIRELKNLINTGKLGKINHIEIEMPQEGFARINKDSKPIVPQQWRLRDNVVPTISLDLGVHLHMFLKYLVNEIPINVVAKSNSYGNFNTIIDNVNCIIEFTNGITCNMWYSKIALGNRNGLKIRIFGASGSAEWVQEFPEILNLANSFGRRWKIDRGDNDIEISNLQRYSRFKVGHPAGFIEAFANYYQDVANALRNYKTNKSINFHECFGIEESYEGIQLFEAIQQSCISKSWEKV